MELSKNIIVYFIFFIISFNAYSLDYERKIQLPKLATKQAVNNIRFISNDGKYTYYQRRTGSLLLSTNYTVKEVLKGKVGTNYLISSSSSRKKLLISRDLFFHTFYGVRKLFSIYSLDYGSTKTKRIGNGISPKLHLDDNWASFYNPNKKILHFKNLKNSALKFSIKLNNKKNPYFIPQVLMSNEDEIFYTDLNNKGITGLIKFNRKTKKYKTQIKANLVNEKFDICLSSNKIFLMEYGLDQSKRGTLISSTSRKSIDFGKREIIYESSYNDRGPLICNSNKDYLYFIKNLGPKNVPKNSHEAVRINTNDLKQTILSNIQFATQIMSLDGKVLLPFRGHYFVLLDKKNRSNLEILEKEKLEKSK